MQARAERATAHAFGSWSKQMKPMGLTPEPRPAPNQALSCPARMELHDLAQDTPIRQMTELFEGADLPYTLSKKRRDVGAMLPI